jgi:hypothetical protein
MPGFVRANLFLLTALSACAAGAIAQPPANRITEPIDEAQVVTLIGNVHPLARAEFDQGAVYSGDTNFLGSSSGILTETVTAFSLSTGSGGITTQTVSSGGTATYDLSITPTTGTTFPMAVTLTVSGLPSGATATISPSTWTQLTSTSWSLPANTALSAITLSIQLPASSSRLDPQGETGRKIPPVLWGVLLLPFASRLRRTGKRVRRAISMMLLLAASLAVVTALGGCGGGSSSNSSQSSDYTITVNATAGAVSSSTTLTLIVN